MEIFETFAIFHAVVLEINPGALLFVVLRLQRVGLKQIVTINELFDPGYPVVLCILQNAYQLPSTKLMLCMLCDVNIPLHISATNGHPQAVQIYEFKITIDVAIVILIFMLFDGLRVTISG
jgi:hypothetical protein